jgi:hypothetical protein
VKTYFTSLKLQSFLYITSPSAIPSSYKSAFYKSGQLVARQLSHTMAQKFTAELVESPRPAALDRQDSIHPGLRPSLVNVPVTPGIQLATYQDSESGSGGSTSYFSGDVTALRNQGAPAQSPSEAAAGAQSSHDILRRMSLSSIANREATKNIDPRVTHSSLSLSGSVISATFCIPHSLNHRKGADWVSLLPIFTDVDPNSCRNLNKDVVHQLYSILSTTSPLATGTTL